MNRPQDHDVTTADGRKAYEQYVETMSNCIQFDYRARCVFMDVGKDGDGDGGNSATAPVPAPLVKPDTTSLDGPVKDKDVATIKGELEKFAALDAVQLNAIETKYKYLLLDHVVMLAEKDYPAFAALFPKEILYLMTSLGFIYYQGSNTADKEEKTEKTSDKIDMEHRFAAFVFERVRSKERMHVIAATYAAAMALGRTGKSTLPLDTPTEYEDMIRVLTINARLSFSLEEYVGKDFSVASDFVTPGQEIKIPVIPATNLSMFMGTSSIGPLSAEDLVVDLGKHFFVDGKFVSQWLVRPFKKLAQGGRKVFQSAHIINHKDDGARRI